MLKLAKFLDTVRQEIAFQFKIAKPKTFKEAIKIAHNVELDLKISTESINNITIKNSYERSGNAKAKTKSSFMKLCCTLQQVHYF